MRNQTLIFGTFVVLALGASACGAPSGDHTGESALSAPSTEQLEALQQDLRVGSSGGEVRTVHAYLANTGYFPNEELAREYPAWRPIVATQPADMSVFDEQTFDAVRQLQAHSGLAQTGVVDADTRALMREPHCGVPEGIAPPDPSDKYDLRGYRLGPVVSYCIWDDNDTLHAAVVASLAAWGSNTKLGFRNTCSEPDITIKWGSLDAGTWGSTDFPNLVHDTITVTMSYWPNWYYGSSKLLVAGQVDAPPPGTLDYRSVLIHELGHALGLSHSGWKTSPSGMPGTSANPLVTPTRLSGTPAGTPVMFPHIDYGDLRRDLKLDDAVAISVPYDHFEHVVGGARDIGAGGDGSVWVIGGDNQIYKWNGSNGWIHELGGGYADRIAVDVGGNPWVIAGAGEVWMRTKGDPYSGTWTHVPSPCARDIASNGGFTWITGCDSRIYRKEWAGWTIDHAGGLGVRIAVDSSGRPWIVNAAGNIFSYTTTDPTIGAWHGMAGLAQDIAISAGDIAGPSFPFVIGNGPNGCGGPIFVLDEQPANDGADAKGEWRQMNDGCGTSIAVGPDGNPWITDSALQISRTRL